MTPGGRCTFVGMEEAPRSRLILLAILEKAQLTVMEERGYAPSLLPTICQLDSLGKRLQL